MRSLDYASLAPIVLFAATALASPPRGNSAARPASPLVTTECDASSLAGLTAKRSPQLASQQKLCNDIRKKVEQAVAQTMEQRRNMAGGSRRCFTLKVYAPVNKPLAEDLAGVERNYTPRPFALRSTCSSDGQVMALSLVPDGKAKGNQSK